MQVRIINEMNVDGEKKDFFFFFWNRKKIEYENLKDFLILYFKIDCVFEMFDCF